MPPVRRAFDMGTSDKFTRVQKGKFAFLNRLTFRQLAKGSAKQTRPGRADPMVDATLCIDRAWRQAMRPEPQIAVSEWADHHRTLPDTAAEPGPWRTSRTPYLREIMDSLSTGSPYERVVMMKGGQTGGTEAGLNWLGYIIHNAPGIVMLVQPSLDMVRRNTVTRIDPLIASSPVLRDLVATPRSRDTGNSLFPSPAASW